MANPKTNDTTQQAVKIIAIASDAAVKKLAIATEKASKKLIKDAEEVATHLRSSAAIVTEAATKLLATQAEAAAKVVNAKGTDDHDSLTTLIGSVANLNERLTEKFNDLRSDIKEIKDGTADKIENHEQRLQDMAREQGSQKTIVRIGIGILTVIFGMLLFHLFGITL